LRNSAIRFAVVDAAPRIFRIASEPSGPFDWSPGSGAMRRPLSARAPPGGQSSEAIGEVGRREAGLLRTWRDGAGWPSLPHPRHGARPAHYVAMAGRSFHIVDGLP